MVSTKTGGHHAANWRNRGGVLPGRLPYRAVTATTILSTTKTPPTMGGGVLAIRLHSKQLRRYLRGVRWFSNSEECPSANLFLNLLDDVGTDRNGGSRRRRGSIANVDTSARVHEQEVIDQFALARHRLGTNAGRVWSQIFLLYRGQYFCTCLRYPFEKTSSAFQSALA